MKCMGKITHYRPGQGEDKQASFLRPTNIVTFIELVNNLTFHDQHTQQLAPLGTKGLTAH